MSKDKEDMEETISGFKSTGQWMDIVEHGERMAAAVRRVLKREEDEGIDREKYTSLLEEFEEWRPKAEDKTERISERTAEQASTNPSKSEKEGKTVREEVSEAQEGMTEAVDSATNLETDETKDNMNDTVEHTQRATDSFLRKCVRWIEKNVYQHIMTRISPYYFDNELVNANLAENRDGSYTLEVNISDDKLSNRVKNEVDEIEDERPAVWRVETDLNEAPAKNVEGAVSNPSDTKTKEQLENSVEDELDSNNSNSSSEDDES